MNEHQYLWPLLVLGTVLLVLAIVMALIYWHVRQKIQLLDFYSHPGYVEEHFRTASAAFTAMVVCGSMGLVFLGTFFFRTLGG